MPGYSYLDNNMWSSGGAASQAAGEAFQRAVVGLQQLKYNQQLQAQQAAFEAQRIAIERQMMQQRQPLIDAQTKYNISGARHDDAMTADLDQQRTAGMRLGELLKDYGSIDPQSTLGIDVMKRKQDVADIMGQGGTIAARSPGSIADNIARLQMLQNPQDARTLALGYPPQQQQHQFATPEQQALARALELQYQQHTQPIKGYGGKETPPDFRAAEQIYNEGLQRAFGTNAPGMSLSPQMQAPRTGGGEYAIGQGIVRRDKSGKVVERMIWDGEKWNPAPLQ